LHRRTNLSLGVGAVLTALFVLVALLAPVIAPYPPDMVIAAARLSPPSPEHWFGTDVLGRDLFSRVLYGARLALKGAAIGVGIAGLIGIPLGLVAGYRGGWLDRLLSRAIEIWLGLPPLLVAIIVIARIGASFTNAMVALGLVSAPAFFRLTRSRVRVLRRQGYIEAARALGAGHGRIMRRHLLPNIAPSLIVIATMRMARLILAGGALSFVGLGAQPPKPEWGALLAEGRDYVGSAPWLALFPGAAITLVALGLNMVGEGLTTWLDVRAPSRPASKVPQDDGSS
jgi:ABC-type dipeptide/oligopeptide/nickel transport system permease subunit